MKVAFAIVGALIVLILFGTMMAGIQDAKTDERTDTFVVTTGVGETEADVIIVGELWEADIMNVTGLASDNVSDAPLPDSYLGVSKVLTVRGLAENDSRNLEVTYLYQGFTDGDSTIARFLDLVPVFVIIAVLMIIAAAIFTAWVSRR